MLPQANSEGLSHMHYPKVRRSESIYLSFYLSLHLSLNLSCFYPSILLSIYSFIHLSFYLPIYLSISPSYLSIYPSIHLYLLLTYLCSTPDKPVHCIVWAKECFKLMFGNATDSMLYEDEANTGI